MRGFRFSWFIAAAIVLSPMTAWAGNQEVAEQIAASLKNSGMLQGYKIGVRFQDGTAWLRGTVSDQEQMNAAVRLAYQTPGVERVINDLAVARRDVVQTTAHEQPATSAPALKQAQGAFAPERVSHSNSAGLVAGIPAQKVTTTPSLIDRIRETVTKPLAVKHADPVPAVAEKTPTVPTAAEEPALAAPELNQIAMTEAPQPTPAAPRPMPIAYSQAPAAAPTPAPAPAPAAAPAPIPAQPQAVAGRPLPAYVASVGGVTPARYDQPHMPNYAWPSYAAYPNYAGVTYPKQYSPAAWPYIGPFYPYPQVPLGWRKVTLEWHDGWWFLDFDDGSTHGPFSGLFRPLRHH
ncbi:MAG: BON domain-containing protein [Planctomycetota bacterium]|nr:MAG: BON domain-containing protein [Planctomycetota bacterium]